MTTDYPNHFARLASPEALERLGALDLGWRRSDASACAALRFLREADNPPVIVGLIGGASSGKSTIFNSLLDANVSRVSAHAHETLGAVAAIHSELKSRFDEWRERHLILPSLAMHWLDTDQSIEGKPDELFVRAHDRIPLSGVILIDLPDVTSAMARDEGAVARAFLPWLDAVLVVVDEERWFDAAVFEDVATSARALGPRLAVVFNQTESGKPLDEQFERLSEIATRRDADDHFASPHIIGSGYRPIEAATAERIRAWISKPRRRDRESQMARYVAGRAGAVLAENIARSEAHAKLCRQVDQYIATAADDARLTYDLLTRDERRLLGLGRKYVPMYDALTGLYARFSRSKSSAAGVDFDKRSDDLSQTLAANFQHRVGAAANHIDNLVADSRYADDATNSDRSWHSDWPSPRFDAVDWSNRIRAHIDAWKDESARNTRRTDAFGLMLVPPLLVADLLFLGGAGMTVWSAAAAGITGLLGGKTAAAVAQKSPAFAAYQTTVRSYQAFVRETLADLWRQNRDAMPRRHLEVSDPIVTALMNVSTPSRDRS